MLSNDAASTSAESPRSKLPFWRRISTAAAPCIILLALLWVPAFNSMLIRADSSTGRALNSLIGHSPVFDHTILTFADEASEERLMLGLAVAALLFVFLAPGRRERARRFSIVLLLGGLVVLGMLAQEFVEDTVQRRSPAQELADLENIEKIYREDVDFEKDASFPSEDAFGLFLLGFVILRSGSLFGLFFLAAGLVFPLARCVVGSHWVSDIYLGALPFAFFTSALIVETRVYRLRRFVEEKTVSALDRIGVVLFKRSDLVDAFVAAGTRDVFAVQSALKDFAKTQLREILSLEDADDLRLEMPMQGSRSIVLIARTNEHAAVLRAYTLDLKSKAQAHVAASVLLEENGLNIPRILFNEECPGGRPLIITVEEYIDGDIRKPDELTSDNLQAIARQFAQLHGIHNDHWGRLGAERSEDFFTANCRKLERELDWLSKQGVAAPVETKALTAWFGSWEDEFKGVPFYSLCHNDLQVENGMFTNDGEYYLLDFSRLQWMPAAREISSLYSRLLRDDEEKIALFTKYYLDAITPAERDLLVRLLPYYLAADQLVRVLKLTRKLPRSQKRSDVLSRRRDEAFRKLVRLTEKSPVRTFPHLDAG